MNKKMVIFYGSCVAIGYSISKIINATRCKKACREAYIDGINTFWEEKLDEAYEHIEKLHQEIKKRDELLEKSTKQTETLINHIKENES